MDYLFLFLLDITFAVPGTIKGGLRNFKTKMIFWRERIEIFGGGQANNKVKILPVDKMGW